MDSLDRNLQILNFVLTDLNFVLTDLNYFGRLFLELN